MKGSIDISPAKRFYSQVFDWNFKPASDDYPEDKLAMFTYPDPKLSTLGGGIVKQEPDKIKSGFIVYLYVDSIEETLAVCFALFSLLLVTLFLHTVVRKR